MKAWKTYRLQLSRVDVNTTEIIPQAPVI
nr:hypothetical protein KXZ65_21810 [Pectobacterium sp. PL152]